MTLTIPQPVRGYRGPAVAYRPARPYFSGTSGAIAPDVPWTFPLAINGVGYIPDLKTGDFRRGFEKRLRDSMDQGVQPGASSVNMSSLWRRQIDNWHHGMGQRRVDDAESDPLRYAYSRRVDPWVRNQICLLPDTLLVTPSTNNNLYLASTGAAVYLTDGVNLSRYEPGLTPTGSMPAAITSITTDGVRVWVADGADGVRYLTHPATALSNWTTRPITLVGYARGRLIGAYGGSLYDLSGNPPVTVSTPLFTAAEGDLFTWVGITGAPGAIYAAGFIGNRSRIYRIGIATDGATLDQPIVAGMLPEGEVVSSIYYYGGLLWIGTRTGVRIATIAAAGDLTVGAMVPMTGPVTQFEGEGQFVWATNTGMKGDPGVAAGLMRFDPTVITEDQAPAYANDLETITTRTCVGVTSLTPTGAVVDPYKGTIGTRWFTIAGSGLFREDTHMSADGYWDWGRLAYGLPGDDKIAYRLDVLSDATGPATTMFADVGTESGITQTTPVWDMRGPKITFNLSQLRGSVFSVRVHMHSEDLMTCPTLRFVQLRAYAIPNRGRVFQVPILLHQSVAWIYAQDRLLDVRAELRRLEELVINPHEVLYQDLGETFRVLVDDIEWVPHHGQGDENFDPYWNGTALVTMKELAE